MSREIVREIAKKHWKKISKKKNVEGYELELKPRIKGGVQLKDEQVFRIYVTEKLPMSKLSSKDVLPTSLSTASTTVTVDVVAIGEICAPPKGGLRDPRGSLDIRRFHYIGESPPSDPTGKYRPVIFGVSIGNLAITAGTLGWAFTRLLDGAMLWGSNAHIFCDYPGRPSSIEKRIVQPGVYDSGTVDDQVALYEWHQQVLSGGLMDTVLVPVFGFIAKYANKLAEAVGAEVRLKVVAKNSINYMDFSVAKPLEEWKPEMLGLNLEGYKFAGLGFAGSDTTGIFCKARYMIDAGYMPLGVKTCEVVDGDIVVKCGRTSGFSSGKIIGSSAYLSVNYGDFTAIFEDVAIVDGSFLQGGDSGSAVWMHCQVN